MITKRQLQNTAVIAATLGATYLALHYNTNWLSSNQANVQRERCYGVSLAGQNDCANSKHACASHAARDADVDEFIMVPKGICARLVGSVSE